MDGENSVVIVRQRFEDLAAEGAFWNTLTAANARRPSFSERRGGQFCLYTNGLFT